MHTVLNVENPDNKMKLYSYNEIILMKNKLFSCDDYNNSQFAYVLDDGTALFIGTNLLQTLLVNEGKNHKRYYLASKDASITIKFNN